MKITEKMLLDGYVGITNGLSSISDINGVRIYWTYREGRDSEGYNVATHDRDKASEITLEYSRSGTISLDDDCVNHPALAWMTEDVDKIVGV